MVLKCFLATVEVCAFCLGRSGKGREKGKPGMNLGLLSFVFLCDSESCVIPYLQVGKRKLRINYCFSHFLNEKKAKILPFHHAFEPVLTFFKKTFPHAFCFVSLAFALLFCLLGFFWRI